MAPELYRTIIDEAHKRGMRVAVHATGVADAKNLLRAGIDVFAHMISDVDEELLALFKQHPNTVVLTALGGPRRIVAAPWLNPPHALVRETVSRGADRASAESAREPDARRRAAGAATPGIV